MKTRHFLMSGRMVILGLCWAMGGLAVAAPPLPPIPIGAISSLTGGPDGFSQSGLAAKAVFDSVNASGGIQKRKLVFLQEDDKGEPGGALQAAARLINENKVVAMAGGASFLECGLNADAYLEKGLVSLPGLALDGRCFVSPMISPVSAGPYVQLELGLRFAAERLKAQKLCVMRLGTPVNVQKAFDAVVRDWIAKTGKSPVLDERDIKTSDSPDDYLKHARQAGCDAIVFAGSESFSMRFARAANSTFKGSIALIFLGSAYTVQVAEELGSAGEGIYALSEFEPWSSRSGALSDWRNLMNTSKLPVTSSSQGGYVAAQVLVRVLRSIRSEINRESVTQAFRQLHPYDVPMLGMPFSFGAGPSHHPNRAAIPMQLSGGRWRIAHFDWIKPLSVAEPGRQ
ncbi:MAG: ABC transporter substrate-binding protein [Polaromonas sp.]